MVSQFFPKLSQNYTELLNDDEYYDITIEVGKDPDVKIFRAHKNILHYRSPYLRRVLSSMSSNKNNNNNVLVHIKLPNMLPEIFQVILGYIYGGIFSFNEQDNSNMLKVLVAADELHLKELVDYLQNYLIKNKAEWMRQNFKSTYQTSFQSNNLLSLQKFCMDFVTKSPEKIFESLDFASLPERVLLSLIKNDDLQMKEIKVWEHVLKWGLAQNSSLIPEPDTWTDNDFKSMENTLKNCLPLIIFFSLSSDEFSQKVRPYKKLLNQQLYDDLLNSYLDSNSKPSDNIPLPRNIKKDGVIDSNIVNLNIVSIISRWIDKTDVNSKFSHLRELYLPYTFKLLLRGSRDGFTPNKFHELCDNKPNTVIFIKVKETGEILGGYNPSVWKSNVNTWEGQSYSFIFSFKNKDKFKDTILSHVKNTDKALYYDNSHGPSFGESDLRLSVFSSSPASLYDIDLEEYNSNICKENHYEKKIRDIEKEFSVEDYEVFQVVKYTPPPAPPTPPKFRTTGLMTKPTKSTNTKYVGIYSKSMKSV